MTAWKRGILTVGLLLSGGRLGLHATTPIRPASKLRLRSSVVLVQDQRTGECLVAKQPEAVVPIASITKLMTAMVVLDAKLDLQEPISIEPEDVDRYRNSRSRLPVRTQLTRGEAMMLALMASENRAANALGRTYPGGLGALVAAMNDKAKALGLQETRFEDPAGLSGGNLASARDLARLVDAAHHYPQIRDFSTRSEATLRSGRRPLQFINTNALVRGHRWQIGLSKTGYLEEAGKCLVMQAQLAKRPVLIVLMDSWGKYTRLGDAQRIKQWLEGPEPAPKRKKRRA
jgi:D-alanyl-D-alanine endopeptidase (penicillin-binding protein 7)